MSCISGMTPEEAQYEAQRAFGGTALTKEKSRAIWDADYSRDLFNALRAEAGPAYQQLITVTHRKKRETPRRLNFL